MGEQSRVGVAAALRIDHGLTLQLHMPQSPRAAHLGLAVRVGKHMACSYRVASHRELFSSDGSLIGSPETHIHNTTTTLQLSGATARTHRELLGIKMDQRMTRAMSTVLRPSAYSSNSSSTYAIKMSMGRSSFELEHVRRAPDVGRR